MSRPTCLLACALLGLIACGPPAEDVDPPDRTTTPPETTPAAELVIAIQSEGKTLDPHTATDAGSMRLSENLYNTLFRYTETYGEIAPDLVTEWSLAQDDRTYTFHLRTDARFHASGRPVTADDVIYSIGRIRELAVRANHFDAVARMDAPDSATLVIELEQPVAPFRTFLAYPMNAVVDREVVEANDGSLDVVDAGSGPFRLVEWRKGRHLLLEAFADYHLPDRPRVDRVRIRPIDDETARLAALEVGEVHLVLDVPVKDVAALEDRPELVVESVGGTFWEYIGLNTRRPPLDDARVRRAIATAVDRDALNELVKFGRARPLTGGHIPEPHWAHADFVMYREPDPDAARTLLDEAGYDGRTLELMVGSSFPYQVQAAQVIKQQLEAVGVAVEIRAMESGVFFDALGSGDFDMTVVGWLGFVDPDEWCYNLFHTGAKWNQQGYSNARVDELLETGRRTLDRAHRAGIYADIQRIVARDAPMVFLYVNEQTSAWRPEVLGYRVHATGTTLWLRQTGLAHTR